MGYLTGNGHVGLGCNLTNSGKPDYYPETNAGKLFTCFYALIGITVVLGSLAPLVAFLRGDWREKLLSALGCAGPKVNIAPISAGKKVLSLFRIRLT